MVMGKGLANVTFIVVVTSTLMTGCLSGRHKMERGPVIWLDDAAGTVPPKPLSVLPEAPGTDSNGGKSHEMTPLPVTSTNEEVCLWATSRHNFTGRKTGLEKKRNSS